ncbi:MAG: hypothetical protein KGL39_07935 [Patescibacteria group bacterium]|nr:hypothetical protein [Patescibacteria group bacterium]
MTRTEIEAFVATLEPPLRQIYQKVYVLVRDAEDTLGNDFQVAARILDAFESTAKSRGLDNFALIIDRSTYSE